MSLLSRPRGSKGYGTCRDAAPRAEPSGAKAPRDKREYAKRKGHLSGLSF